LVDEAAADLLAKGIEQDRFLNDFAWKHSLGEARDEKRIETQPAGGLDWADQDPAVTVWWGRDSSLQE
jgi:hypothetical protein